MNFFFTYNLFLAKQINFRSTYSFSHKKTCPFEYYLNNITEYYYLNITDRLTN